MGKSTTSMVIFNSYVTNYQRVIVVGDEKGKGTHMLLVGALELFGAIEFCDFPKKNMGCHPSH